MCSFLGEKMKLSEYKTILLVMSVFFMNRQSGFNKVFRWKMIYEFLYVTVIRQRGVYCSGTRIVKMADLLFILLILWEMPQQASLVQTLTLLTL
jgi:hypothetical protein